MINAFSKKYTDSGKAVLNGAEFVTVKIEGGQEKLSRMGKATDPVMVKMIQYLVFQFVKVILGILGIIIIGMSQDSGSQAGLMAGFFAIVAAMAIHIFSKNKMQQSIYSDELDKMGKENDSFAEYRIRQFGIPAEAVEIEVMYLLYEPENVEMITYFNEPVQTFLEGDTWCIATKMEKLTFPITDITSVQKVNKAAALDSWNKENGYDEGIYKQYAMKSDASIYDQYYITTDYGRGVVIPYYYVIAIKERYEIVIPPYELDTVLELTGMKVS